MPEAIDLTVALLDVTDAHGGRILGPNDLACAAAEQSARTLVDNWSSAVHFDGLQALTRYLGDVDDVIAILTEWRDAVGYAITTGKIADPAT